MAASAPTAAAIEVGLALYASLMIVAPLGRSVTCIRIGDTAAFASAATTASSGTPTTPATAIARRRVPRHVCAARRRAGTGRSPTGCRS